MTPRRLILKLILRWLAKASAPEAGTIHTAAGNRLKELGLGPRVNLVH